MSASREPEPRRGPYAVEAADPPRASGWSAGTGDAPADHGDRQRTSPPRMRAFQADETGDAEQPQAVGDPEVVEDVRRAQEGSAHAFASLYDRYAGQVFAFVYHRVGHRQTAEDLVGDVFLRALRRIDTFTWQGVDFGAWLITIARNRVNDYFKSARFRLEAPVEEIFDTTGESPDLDEPENVAMTKEVASHVHHALGQMKDEHAEVLYLRFIQHLNVAETGAVLGKSDGAVKALQYRALKSLARLVPEELTE